LDSGYAIFELSNSYQEAIEPISINRLGVKTPISNFDLSSCSVHESWTSKYTLKTHKTQLFV